MNSSEPVLIKLGRNSVTTNASASDDAYHVAQLSRNHVELTVNNQVLYIKYVGRCEGLLTKNGEKVMNEMVPLSIGDEVSLLGTINYFNYKVKNVRKRPLNHDNTENTKVSSSIVIDLESPTPAPAPAPSSSANDVISLDTTTSTVSTEVAAPVTATSSSTAPVDAAAVAEASSKAIQGHMECMICFELIAFAHNISPCGDSFCYECITSWSSRKQTCPSCQAPFQISAAVPNRLLDNIIREVLERTSVGAHENNPELIAWETRLSNGKTLKRVSTEETPHKPATSSSTFTAPPPMLHYHPQAAHFAYEAAMAHPALHPALFAQFARAPRGGRGGATRMSPQHGGGRGNASSSRSTTGAGRGAGAGSGTSDVVDLT